TRAGRVPPRRVARAPVGRGGSWGRTVRPRRRCCGGRWFKPRTARPRSRLGFPPMRARIASASKATPRTADWGLLRRSWRVGRLRTERANEGNTSLKRRRRISSYFARTSGLCCNTPRCSLGWICGAQPVPKENRDERLGVADCAVERPGQRLLPGDNVRLQILILLEPHRSRRKLLGEEQVGALAEYPGRRNELRQLAPASRPVAGLLRQFPRGGRFRGFAWFQGAGRDLHEGGAD